MQAIVQERYGGPEVLASREIDKPGIGDREVLARVHAAGLHIGDVFGVRGSPFPIRFTSGLRGPKFGVPGFDIAGTVEATGSAVTRFAPGDEVFGICSWPSSGACAEYARADEDTLVGREGFVAVVECVEPNGADTAEVAIAVAEAFQHRGIGRRLMAACAAWARRERIARFTATMLVSNAPIHRLLIGLGAPTRLRYVGGGVAEITIDLVGQSVAA